MIIIASCSERDNGVVSVIPIISLKAQTRIMYIAMREIFDVR